MEDIKKLQEILLEQEEKLCFKQFNQEDAYALGTLMAEYAKNHNIVIAFSVVLNNGSVVFQYLPDGTNLLNQKWMKRKFNTVKLTGHSSLLTSLMWEQDGADASTHGLCAAEYALCGGGFPIRIQGSKVVLGAVISSNLFHAADHEFVVNCLKEYLKCSEVPDFPYSIP